VSGIVALKVRIAEVELDAMAQQRVAGTARQFVECVILGRVKAAESAQPLGILRGAPCAKPRQRISRVAAILN
jgi:hypothetical protein